MLRIERHELDVADLEAVFARVARQGNDVRLHQILHRHGVELDLLIPEPLAGVEPGQHLGEIVAAGDGLKTCAIEGVEVDVDAPQPGVDTMAPPVPAAARRWW